MRIYSNKLLSWPQIIHVTHAARLYSGVWCNYNFYTIKSIDPLEISTWAPLQLLEKDRYYYCYDNYMYVISNKQPRNNVTILNNNRFIYYPTRIKSGDYLVIQDDYIAFPPTCHRNITPLLF